MSNDYRLEVVAGASRSGKSFETARRVKTEQNVLVWDAVGEFAALPSYQSTNDARMLAHRCARGVTGRCAFVVPVTAANFDVWCRSAWVWLRILAHRGERACLVVEELADVTPPGKAPPAWGEIIRKSLRYGTRLYALTQRPAESDKTVLGNATVLRCHSMARAADRRAMAAELDVDQSVIDGLDFSKYQYVERDRTTRRLVTAGKGIKRRTL